MVSQFCFALFKKEYLFLRDILKCYRGRDICVGLNKTLKRKMRASGI